MMMLTSIDVENPGRLIGNSEPIRNLSIAETLPNQLRQSRSALSQKFHLGALRSLMP